MWIEVRRACEAVQNFEDLESATECAELMKDIEKFKWKIQNILKNQSKSPAERAKLKADAEIPIDGVEVKIDQSICDETIIISDIFNINEMDALELVLSGESQKIHFDCLNRGLIAVVCYYDLHRLLAVLLRTMLDWDKDSMHESLRVFIEQNFVQRTMFQHLLQIQATFNVISEFHMLSQPHVNGLGGPKHQNLLRNVIEEIRENCAEAMYTLCEWGAEHANEFLMDIYPILKGVPLAEKFSAHHLSAWICLNKLTSHQVLSQTNTAAAVLSNFVKEIRNETVWSDQSVCGTAQLACAIALKSLAVSPADHWSITNVEVDVDKVVERAVRNMALLFIRHGVIGSDYFKQCCSHIRVVDNLLKQLIALFPAKLMEIERNSEDELTWVDEMTEKGQQATPALHYETLLRCISDLYQVINDAKASEAVKSCIIQLSLAYSSAGSMELCRFIERARLPHHVVHAVAYLDFLCAVCRTRQVASFIFDVFARIPARDDECMGWDHVMSALRSYERLFRERSARTTMFGHSLSAQQQTKPIIPSRELIGLISWINLSRIVVELDEEAAEVFLEERQLAVLDAALGVVTAPVPLPLKGALLRLVAALARREASALRIWTAMNAHQLCTFAENGSLLGLQKELEERECSEEMFDTSLGLAHVLRSLLSHSHMSIPDFAAPYLQYLTKSIVCQMASRSYKDIEQFYELEEVSLSALLCILKQSYVDTRAVIRREPHIALLIQILNDTAVFRAICGVLLEDVVNVQDQLTSTARGTSAPALPAIRLLSIAVSRYAVLRASIRGSDTDIMLTPLQTLLLSPLQPSGVNILDIVLQYIEQADDLPCHALYAGRILREMCAIRPSLQSQMVELLRARRAVARNVRAIRSVLNPSMIRYTVTDMVTPELDESDPIRTRGEAALVVMEALSDSVESDPGGGNLCFLLFGFKTGIDGSGRLCEIDSQPTGFHQVLSLLEQFVGARNPFDLQFSSLFEPSFRLLQRLVSIDCAYSQAVLRFIRSVNLIQQLVASPFLSTTLSQDPSDGPTLLSVTRMISGSILHLAALEVSTLLQSGHFNIPHEMYSKLLEASDAVVNSEEKTEGVDNLLFSLLRHGHIELTEEIAYPRLVHFNAHKLQTLFETCKTTTVFNISQYDIEYLHMLLTREIVSTQADDTTAVTREMEAVLTYGTDVNAQLLQRGASGQLVSGCTALLNVMAFFAPVPFFSNASQLEMLMDAAFLLVEYVSGCGADEQIAVCATLLRLCKSICALTKQECVEASERRSVLAHLLNPLLELLVQPGERTLQAKVSIYGSVRLCLREAYVRPETKTANDSNEDWLRSGVVRDDGSVSISDPIAEVLNTMAYELSQCISRDIVDLPEQHKCTPLLLLGDVLHEDKRAFAGLVSKTGVARYMTDLLASIEIDWVALSRRESDDLHSHVLFDSLVIALTRLAFTDSGWNALAQLALPEVLAQLRMFEQPPKQLFLQPASVKEKNSPAELFISSFEVVIQLCCAICAKPKWKRLSFKILDVVYSQTELLSQLMRADIQCRMMDVTAMLVQFIWDNDNATRPIIENNAMLTQIRGRSRNPAACQQMVKKPYSFVNPSLLSPQIVR